MLDIKIDGVSTSSIAGVQLVNSGENVSSVKRFNTNTVYGMNGTSRELEAYDEKERTLQFHCQSFSDVTNLISLFDGQDKKIEFWYIKGSFYYYDFVEAKYSPVTMLSWDVEINISVKPFRYVKDVPDLVMTKSGVLKNIGTIYSEPKIIVEGSGAVSLTIGSQVMRLQLDTKATIECRHGFQNIYDKNGNLKNSIRQSGSFFEIPAGQSVGVVLGNGITKVTISPRWRYKV
ncbi:hypothetical protein [Streptococcus suis]|uniref:hypothetical protein n=1 Tax=Streptococcus suis TaxID=1307 RepID=UPI0015830120|nr:hypothetical protein [Streptococcus suis]MCG9862667.1 hypothetical protein [Streptococcus suis]MCG9883908.1 hypothetical protein [Streptococcus suis]HEM6498933.1 hypothetical protein [Streptococcus suis]